MNAVITINDLPLPPIGKTGWPWNVSADSHIRECLPEHIPIVTIVTPSFNQGEYLEETIRSVLLQGYPELEYKVMDGGSTDESLSIIKKYSKWIDCWVSEPDKGQADAINKGFKHCKGELFAWLNSDDYYLPGGLTRLVSAWLETKADFIHGDVWQVKDHRLPYPWRTGEVFDYEKSLLSLHIPIPQQGALWTRSLWKKVGGLDPKWHCVLDRVFFNRAGLNHQFHYVSEAIAVSRIHEDAKSHSLQLKWIEELPAMYQEFFLMPNLPHHIQKLKKQTMYSVWQRCAGIARHNGLPAYPYLLKAVKESPRMFVYDEINYLKLKCSKVLNSL